MMKSILVIDDNPNILDNTAEILELAGYTVYTAENGKIGVDLAMQHKPSLIVCDIMMPELDGYGVLHLIRKNDVLKNIPFVFLTAKTERSDFRKGMEMGADDYITKPFDDIELLNAIDVRLKKAAILENKYDSSIAGLNQFVADVNNTGMIDQFNEQFESVFFNRKQLLYQETKRPRFMYLLVKGKIKTFKTNEDGKELITNMYVDGDFIGYTALITDQQYEDSAEVLEDADVIQVPKDDFMKMIFGDMNIASKFIQLITRNVQEKEERLLSLAYSSLRKRVAKALVDILEKFSDDEKLVPIEISREDLAQYIGTATESLIRTLSDFKSEKLLSIKNGNILIDQPDKLKNLLY